MKRVEGLPNAVALVLNHSGGLSAERLRIYFDTDPKAGEPNSGGDFLIEGPSFYAYPKGGTGWSWNRVGEPVFQSKDGQLVAVVAAPELGKPFSWFVEVTTADWNVGQRFPLTGMTRVEPAKLAALPQPAAAKPVDMGPLLAARAVSLSVKLNGGPDLADWTEVKSADASIVSGDGKSSANSETIAIGFDKFASRLAELGFGAGARLQATLRDAAPKGGSAALVPERMWTRGNDFAWTGVALGVRWVLFTEEPKKGELRLTGWLRADAARVLRIEAGLALPLAGRTWADDMSTSRKIEAGGEAIYGNFAGGRYGVDARQSFYPFGVVEDGERALVVETDPTEPRVFVVGAGANFLRADYDLALSPETTKFPGQATFRVSFYSVERAGENGFRATLAEFFKRYPDYNERRVPHSGLWMPFSDISKLKDPEDFGFSFFEKVGERGADVDYAKKNNVLTLMYTEPWLYWLPFNDGEARTPARALEKMQQLSALGSGWSRDLASSGMAGAARDAKGDIQTKFMDLPWNKGARMEVNSDPDLTPATPGGMNRASAEWIRISEWLDDPRVDGIYLDSMDAIVQPDHAASAMHSADYPATFTSAARVPVMAPNVPQYEFTAALGQLLRSRGKYLMANFPLVDAPFINRWIDIPGEETDWWSGGQYNPNSRARLDYRRALSGQKPFGFLQSTEFNTFEGEPLRRYFETCLLYGFLPSFFSHNAADNPYFADPKLMDRDRPFFRTFVPLIRRVADAGWQPVREARLFEAAVAVGGTSAGAGTSIGASTSDVESVDVRLEQFGRSADGLWHLTLQNQVEAPRVVRVVLPKGLKKILWLDPQTGQGGWAQGGESIAFTLEPHAALTLDLVDATRTQDERAFLTNWRSGGDEAATASRSFESLLSEAAAGVRAQVSAVGAVITGEASAWTLRVRNENLDTVELRIDGAKPLVIAGGAEFETRVTLPAAKDGSEAHVVSWSILAGGKETRFSRAVRVRAVAPVEATGPGRRVVSREKSAAIPVLLKNHSAEMRECVLEWSAADGAKPTQQTVRLAAGASETVTLWAKRPAGASALSLTLKMTSRERVLWQAETRVVFLDARASLTSEAGVQVTADTTFGGYTTKPLNDGVADNADLAWNEAAWASEDSPAEHWVRVAFPQPVAVEEIVIHWHHEGGATYTGREGVILGEVATGQELVIANWKSKPGEKSTRVKFTRQMLKTIRVTQNPSAGAAIRPGIMWLSEIEAN